MASQVLSQHLNANHARCNLSAPCSRGGAASAKMPSCMDARWRRQSHGAGTPKCQHNVMTGAHLQRSHLGQQQGSILSTILLCIAAFSQRLCLDLSHGCRAHHASLCRSYRSRAIYCILAQGISADWAALQLRPRSASEQAGTSRQRKACQMLCTDIALRIAGISQICEAHSAASRRAGALQLQGRGRAAPKSTCWAPKEDSRAARPEKPQTKAYKQWKSLPAFVRSVCACPTLPCAKAP